MCLNCSSPSPLLRLARYLEAALCRAATSRLAVPFMRPLLPLNTSRPSNRSSSSSSSDNSDNRSKSKSSSSSSGSTHTGPRSGIKHGPCSPVDLLHLIEKVSFFSRSLPAHFFLYFVFLFLPYFLSFLLCVSSLSFVLYLI